MIEEWDATGGRGQAIDPWIQSKAKAPPCLLEKFTKLQNAYNLRGSFTKLSLPLPKTNYGKRRFSYKGAYLWNRLPEDMRNSESLNIFKNKLKRLPPCFFDSL